MFKFAIFGAKSIALGTFKAMQELYKDFSVVAFLVSSRIDNPSTLAGIPVYELENFDQKDVCILIATPDDVQGEIVQMLEQNGFHNHICVDSRIESELMEKYYTQIKAFRSLHTLQDKG